jgi:hypothetical protein
MKVNEIPTKRNKYSTQALAVTQTEMKKQIGSFQGFAV